MERGDSFAQDVMSKEGCYTGFRGTEVWFESLLIVRDIDGIGEGFPEYDFPWSADFLPIERLNLHLLSQDSTANGRSEHEGLLDLFPWRGVRFEILLIGRD